MEQQIYIWRWAISQWKYLFFCPWMSAKKREKFDERSLWILIRAVVFVCGWLAKQFSIHSMMLDSFCCKLLLFKLIDSPQRRLKPMLHLESRVDPVLKLFQLFISRVGQRHVSVALCRFPLRAWEGRPFQLTEVESLFAETQTLGISLSKNLQIEPSSIVKLIFCRKVLLLLALFCFRRQSLHSFQDVSSFLSFRSVVVFEMFF